MRGTTVFAAACVAALVLGVAAARSLPASADDGAYEVWAIDQSGAGGTLYVYDGTALASNPATATAEVIALGPAVAAACAPTGGTPTRAHMLLFNTGNTHAILSYVATGHVVFVDVQTRTAVGCVRASAGAGGARQAHAAVPTPDDTAVIVANQNGKLLERIRTDYATNTFALEPAAALDLAGCVTPNGILCQHSTLRPDNAPICPILDTSGRLAFVTLRGGGLFVVDPRSSPMRIVAEYDRATVHPNGCGGIQKARTMYVNSGAGASGEAHLYAFDLAAYPKSGYSAPNLPAPTTVFARHGGSNDSHGAARAGRFLWAADRFANLIEVVDTVTGSPSGAFSLVGTASDDPAPDLLDTAPGGGVAFATLRGPCPLTANTAGLNNAVGSTPGVGVIEVRAGGRGGALIGVAPIHNVDPAGTSCAPSGAPPSSDRADPHALRVRLK